MKERNERQGYSAYLKAAYASVFTLGTFLLAKTTGILPAWFSSGEDSETNHQLTKRAEQENEFVINSGLSLNNANNPSLDSFSDGSFVVTWGVGTQQIFGKTYDSAANPVVTEFAISPVDPNWALSSHVATITNNLFTVSYVAGYNGATAQSFNKSGGPVGSLFNEYSCETLPCSTIFSINNNDLLLVYQSAKFARPIMAREFDVNGTQLSDYDFAVNQFSASHPAAISLANGDYVIAWDNNATGIFVNQFLSNSTAKFALEFQVNTYVGYTQTTYTRTWAHDHGNFLVIWQSPQCYPKMASLGNNGYVIVWQSYAQDGSGYGVFGRLYDLMSSPKGAVFQINTYTQGNQTYPDVAGFTDGTFIVVWQDDRTNNNITGIFGQRFDSKGMFLGSGFQINDLSTAAYSPSVAPLLNSGCMVVWSTSDLDNFGNIIGKRILFYSPTLTNNNFTLIQNANTTITSIMLNATDAYTSNSDIIFSIANLTQGYFEQITNPGHPISEFTQQQVMSNQINFVHDGSLYSPNFIFFIKDALSTIGPFNANINFIPFHYFPVLAVNQLAIIEGQTVILTSGNLQATSVYGNNNNLVFIITDLIHGQFGTINNPTQAIPQFTQLQLNNGSIQFTQNGGKLAPSYSVSVSDGTVSTPPAPVAVNFLTVHNKPQLVNAQMKIDRGQTIILNASDLNSTGDNVSFSQLLWTVISIQQGQFALVNVPDRLILNFTQLQVNQEIIQFTHDGSTQAPSFSLLLNDGTDLAGPFPMSISFSQGNFSNSTAAVSATPGIVGGVIAGVGGVALLAAGLGLFAIKQINQSTRNKHRFASYIWEELKLKGIDNFETDMGQNYVAMVEGNLIPTLKDHNYDIDQMRDPELRELAKNIAIVAKNKITYKTNFFGSSLITVDDLNQQVAAIVQGVLNREYLLNATVENDDEIGLKNYLPSFNLNPNKFEQV